MWKAVSIVGWCLALLLTILWLRETGKQPQLVALSQEQAVDGAAAEQAANQRSSETTSLEDQLRVLTAKLDSAEAQILELRAEEVRVLTAKLDSAEAQVQKLNAEIDDSTSDLASEISAQLPEEPAAGFTAEQLMAYMDANGDGKITMDEAPEEVKTGFSFIDANGDGGIDMKEAQVMAAFSNDAQPQSPQVATGGATAEQLMAYMDANGDGKITMDEAPEELKTAFALLDQNADGGIDVKEAQVMASGMNNQ